MKNLAGLWTQHLKDQDARDHFTKTILNSTNDVVLMRLKAIIKAKRESIEASERYQANYDSPNWAYKEADTIGCIRTLAYIQTLLDFVKD